MRIFPMVADERYVWILKYLFKYGVTTTLSIHFVTEYCMSTGMNRRDGKSKQLVLDLTHMFNTNMLQRERKGTTSRERDLIGKIKWYYSYSVASEGYIKLNEIQLIDNESLDPV